MKLNQQSMVVEKGMEPCGERRGVSKEKLLENGKRKIEKLLDSIFLDMSKSHMLGTQDMTEAKY
jgi:pre-mRNA-splicing factor SYF2